MSEQPNDTHQEAEKVLITLIRNASIAERMSHVRSLSETVMYLSRRAIQRANPNMTELELDLAFITLHYGKPLADKVREYLLNRNGDSK
jgi:hypothetical protein